MYFKMIHILSAMIAMHQLTALTTNQMIRLQNENTNLVENNTFIVRLTPGYYFKC